MTKARLYFVVVALAVSVAVPAWAQTPNLSGTWKFEAAKSRCNTTSKDKNQ
jgi:hypothetical protein